MWETLIFPAVGISLSALIVAADTWLGADKVKRRVLLAVFRDEPTVEVVRQGKVEQRSSYYGVQNVMRSKPWSNRKLAALLICITEGLVEEKQGKYVLTDMGRLSFSNPEKRKK